jgi:hypothetical protein
MQGVGFSASRSRGPKARVYSWRVGSSRRSRGTSGNRARNSSTDIGVAVEGNTVNSHPVCHVLAIRHVKISKRDGESVPDMNQVA